MADLWYSVAATLPVTDLVFQSVISANASTTQFHYNRIQREQPKYAILQPQANSDLTLHSGSTMLIYATNPGSISVTDVDLTVAITVFTAQAMCYKETNVNAN
jgi:hypothetical protein